RLGDCADESSKAGGPGTGWEPRGVRTTSFGPAAAVTVRAGNIRQARSRVRGRVRGQRDDDSQQKEGYSTSLLRPVERSTGRFSFRATYLPMHLGRHSRCTRVWRRPHIALRHAHDVLRLTPAESPPAGLAP